MKYVVSAGLELPYEDAEDGTGYAKEGEIVEGDFTHWRSRSWVTPLEGESDGLDHRALYESESRQALIALIESASFRPDQLKELSVLELARRRPRKSILESITAQFRGE